MEVLRKIASVIDAFSERTGRAVAWLTLVVVLIGAFNAVARYLAKFIGVDLSSNAFIELQWYLFATIFLLGAAYTLKHNAHVRVDVLYDRFGPKTRAWINLVGHILFLIPFCVFMIFVTTPYVINSWKGWEGSPDPGGLPRYPIKTMMPIAFVLLLIQGIGETLKQILHLWGGEGELEFDETEAAL